MPALRLKTVPQIFHGDSLIGGFSELSDLDKRDQLNSLEMKLDSTDQCGRRISAGSTI